MVLEAKNLSKKYKGKTTVDDLSIRVATGEIVGLLGPNGAGKTTTFYMLIGMVMPDHGMVTIDNEDISGIPMYKRALKGISYLPQEPSIFRRLTVRENLLAILEIRGLSKGDMAEKLERLLDEFNLSEFSDRPAYKLSGGERRRTEIAMAIAADPTFILFDEPFAGIDPLAIIELKKMLTYLKEKDMGILVTDHNVRDTLTITDRAYIISNGRVLDHGGPEELISNPKVRETYLGEGFRL